MKLFAPKIETKKLTKKELALYHNLNAVPYGNALATSVSQKLIKSKDAHHGLYHSHRDYCGLGLFYENGLFTLATVNDGYGPDSTVASFDSQTYFISWLAHENDQSMSLYGEKFNNQTITKIRLEWYLEDNYSPVWNAYCTYVRSF
ncbi:hypothetical protein ACFQZJ_02015 [Maribacter chungangensis]|uniref:Uncharacterized protein n=1 Tax=Maribacter chungangensis TaxID=1069117 RepID=A0ABW3B037_9FLAO